MRRPQLDQAGPRARRAREWHMGAGCANNKGRLGWQPPARGSRSAAAVLRLRLLRRALGVLLAIALFERAHVALWEAGRRGGAALS